MHQNIPIELRSLPQWVSVDMSIDPETGKPRKWPINPATKSKADVTNPFTWGTFEQAVALGQPIGFVFTESDPYCVIDLDNKPYNPATDEQLSRHTKILESFNSYTEKSISGFGYHIIVKGSVPSGINRDKVEVYSSGRYMIFTGNVINSSPIQPYQEWLDILYGEMRPAPTVDLDDSFESEVSDAYICEMASNAANGDKYIALCNGDMTGYPSQSEADFALLSIIAFYTKDNNQVRRLFRYSQLGKREKATKNNVAIDFALSKIRAQQPPPIDLTTLAENAKLVNKPKPPAPPEIPVSTVPIAPEPTPSNKVKYPPGLIGEIAEYFMATSIRPVPEIALTAAIALTAGICGRSYNISGTGLNQYLVLLAKTGSGKEGALAGMENLMAAVRPQLPMISEFLGPATFASGQALIKVLNERPCFVSVLGEFGLTLQQISDHRANNAEKMLKKVLLDLYGKSGWNRLLQSSVYSDIEKNTKVVQAPNVTIFGESTPETFFEGLDTSHIAEGLIPRFSIIEYKGDRPKRNLNANCPPSQALKQAFSNFAAASIAISMANKCVDVQMNAPSQLLLDNFDIMADNIMNATKSEVEVQLWNRAHLKVLKLAALIAVGVNPNAPTINEEIAQYSIDFIKKDIHSITKRFQSGDVGQGENRQHFDVKTAIEVYFKLSRDQIRKLVGSENAIGLRDKQIIPYQFLFRRVCAYASFRNDKLGAAAALKRTLKEMVDQGVLIELNKIQLSKDHGFSGVAFGIGQEWIE